MKRKLEAQKRVISIQEYQTTNDEIHSLSKTVLQSKAIEISVETISQILLLLGFVSFYSYSVRTEGGQRYSYFYGVAKVVLQGNKLLFLTSLILSLLTPSFFYVSWVNHHKHMSLNMSRQLVLVVRNLLLLVARVGAITSALVIPVIRDSDFASQHVTEDMTTLLNDISINKDFTDNFHPALISVSREVGTNAQFLLLLLVLHLMAVVRFTRIPLGRVKERLLHLLLSTWLPLPYLTMRGVDRGEEVAEEIFLTIFHAVENLLLLAVSRAFYLLTYPTAILTADLLLLLCQVLGSLLSLLYHTKVELYSSIRGSSTPQEPRASEGAHLEMEEMGQDISVMERRGERPTGGHADGYGEAREEVIHADIEVDKEDGQEEMTQAADGREKEEVREIIPEMNGGKEKEVSDEEEV